MILYHGSIYKVRKPTNLRGKVRTDFGKGFYTTTSFEQAKKWALIKKSRATDPENTKAIVCVYEVDDAILEKGYNVMHFKQPTTEWLDFVVKNRNKDDKHDYDLVMGPVANDKLYATLLLYEQNALSAEATIAELKTHVLFDQLSFHTIDSIRELKYIRSEEVSE